MSLFNKGVCFFFTSFLSAICYLCFNYICLKSFYHGWHCLWGSSLPYRQRLPSQSGSSVLPAGSLLLTATGLPLRWWRTWSCWSAICDCWETCHLIEKPTFFVVWLWSNILNIYVLNCLKCVFLALKSQLFWQKVTFGVSNVPKVFDLQNLLVM